MTGVLPRPSWGVLEHSCSTATVPVWLCSGANAATAAACSRRQLDARAADGALVLQLLHHSDRAGQVFLCLADFLLPAREIHGNRRLSAYPQASMLAKVFAKCRPCAGQGCFCSRPCLMSHIPHVSQCCCPLFVKPLCQQCLLCGIQLLLQSFALKQRCPVVGDQHLY